LARQIEEVAMIRPVRLLFVVAALMLGVGIAACGDGGDDAADDTTTTTEEAATTTEAVTTTAAAEAEPAVPACDLLTPEEVARAMEYPEPTAAVFDEDGVCKFVAQQGGVAVFGDGVSIMSATLGDGSLQSFAETFGEATGVQGGDGMPLAVEFGEEVAGLGDEALAATTEIRALAVRVGDRAFIVGVTMASRDYQAEVRSLADLAVARL
jgi:hypothetical protein